MIISGIKEEKFDECLSWRECSFYINYLYDNTDRTYKFEKLRDYSSLLTCSDDIKTSLDNNYYDKRGMLTKEMKLEFNKQQLESSYFTFLDKKHERVCSWAWLFLKKYIIRFDNERLDSSPFEEGRNNVRFGSYGNHSPKLRLDHESLEHNPTSVYDRYCDIENAFKLSEVDREGQKDIIKLMVHIWAEIYQKQNTLNWVDSKNTEQCIWICDYIKKSEYRRYFTAWPPVNNDERYLAIQAIFDHGSWEYSDKVTLLMNSMKKAWSQKKFRDKSNGKKPYSITMTIKTKERLDELVAHHELKITDIIERLIKEEYEKTTK